MYCPFPPTPEYDGTVIPPNRFPFVLTETGLSFPADVFLSGQGPSIPTDVFYLDDYPQYHWTLEDSNAGRDEAWRWDVTRDLFRKPGLTKNRFLEMFTRTRKNFLENCDFEEQLDCNIELFQEKRPLYFQEIGGDFFEGEQLDETPNYSTHKGHFVQLSSWKWMQDNEIILFLSDMKQEEVLFEELFNCVALLEKFQELAQKDLDRLWRKSHDGKACRYYREGDESPDAPLDPGLPWYLCNNNVNFGIDYERKTCLHEEECLFCCLDRRLHGVEYNFYMLKNYLQVWPNGRSLPPGAQEAIKKRRMMARTDGYSSDDSDTVTNPWIGFVWKPTDDELPKRMRPSSMHRFGKRLPNEFDRHHEHTCRLMNLEQKAMVLERLLDKQIANYVVWKRESFLCHARGLFNGTKFDKNPKFSRHDPHFVQFNYPPIGIQDLTEVLFLSQEGEDSVLFEDNFQRAEYIRQFLVQAQYDLDRLWFKVHDGNSSRYYPQGDGPSNHNYDPAIPWYLHGIQVDWHSKDVPHAALHLNECAFCILDRKCSQLEVDMIRLYHYQSRWMNQTHMPRGSEAAISKRKEIEERLSELRRASNLDSLLGGDEAPQS